MRTCISFIIVYLLAFSAFPQKTISAESARQDLTLLYKSLVERHPGVYRHVTEAELKNRYDEAINSSNRDLTFWEFYRIASRLNSAIKCGHTRLGLPEGARKEFIANGKFFPLPVLFADTIMYARWPDKSITRITAINGKNVSDIMQTIFKGFTEDGNSVRSKYDVSEVSFPRQYARSIEVSPAKFDIEFISAANAPQRKSIAPLGWNEALELSFYGPEDVKPASFKMIGDVGYLSIATFDSGTYTSASMNYNDFLETTFAELKKNKIKKLIVDIRRNGGGADQFGANLCSYFTTKPFSYFRTVKQLSGNGYAPVGHSCLSIQQPAANAFTGKICLLIDGLTFSTAADVASITWANHFARVIGRETGGGYDGNTSGRSESVTLDNSGITVTIPQWYYENAVPPAQELHRGVIPNVLINRTKESIEQHKDLEVEEAMKWLNSSK